MLPCPFKVLTGIDCPFCGLQRATFALLEGDLISSITYYPALIPGVIGLSLYTLQVLFGWNQLNRLTRPLLSISAVLVLGYWIMKITGIVNCPV